MTLNGNNSDNQLRVSIPQLPGVYALIMRLTEEVPIVFDRNGTQEVFPSGWYVYIGSARGPGGLRRRTDRHQKLRNSGKKMHWNVDYFREHASINEIWFSCTGSEQREHDWAHAIANLPDAQVLIDGFGASDCKRKCPAHFFHFPTQPFVAGFRAGLRTCIRDDVEVLVDFVDGNSLATEQDAPTIRMCYERARRFTERRRHRIQQDGNDEAKWKSLACGQPARRLIENVAAELSVSFKQLEADVELAEAIEQIICNCGQQTTQAIFRSHQTQTPTAILKCSRKSIEVQRHRVSVVLDPTSRAWSISPQGSEKIVDTKDFKKILSRMARTRGTLELGCKLVRSPVVNDFPREWIDRLNVTIREFTTALERHEGLVQKLGVKAGECRRRQPAKPKNQLQLDGLLGQLRRSLGLLRKNVRDIPRSSYDLRPTERQLKSADRESSRIRSACHRILHAIGSPGPAAEKNLASVE